MIKDIIVNLGLGARDPAGNFAISVAASFEAHVLGVAFSYEPIIPYSMMGGIPPEFIESQRAESNKRARAAIARFEQAAKRAGISFETRTLSASISGASDQLARMGRRFDVIVVGQADTRQADAGGSGRRRRAVRERPAVDLRAVHPDGGPQA